MPPARTGIAAYSAEALSLLAHDLEIDVYDEPRAHDFVWKQTKQPYDLIVYQIGNSRGHAYQCFCSSEQLETDRQAALAAGRAPKCTVSPWKCGYTSSA